MNNYQPRQWSPYLPNSDILRIEFLITLRNIWDSPLSKKSAFLGETLRKLTAPGVLNATHISILTGHSTRYIHQVADTLKIKLPETRSIFDPSTLPLLQTCLHQLANGQGVSYDHLSVLSMIIGPSLAEALLGIPNYILIRRRTVARKRQLAALSTWEG